MDAFPQEGMPEAQKTSWENMVRNKQQVRRLPLRFLNVPFFRIATTVLVICQEAVSLNLLITENLDTVVFKIFIYIKYSYIKNIQGVTEYSQIKFFSPTVGSVWYKNLERPEYFS